MTVNPSSLDMGHINRIGDVGVTMGFDLVIITTEYDYVVISEGILVMCQYVLCSLLSKFIQSCTITSN